LTLAWGFSFCGRSMSTEALKRKLAAIQSADARGHSRIMGQDEAATFKISETWKGITPDFIGQHRGGVVYSPGETLFPQASAA
jgi:adenylate cyclase